MNENMNMQGQQQPVEEKKKFSIKIAGFTFTIKHFVILGIIVAIIGIGSAVSSYKDKKAREEAIAAAEAEEEEEENTTEDSFDDDYDAMLQEQLREKYGEPPAGFMWDEEGNLFAIGDDDKSSAEDVTYMFIRALSVLDFSTAERYSNKSSVISAYKDYYEELGDIDYYDNFLRKQFKESLTSIELNEVKDTAVFADGSNYVTLDLSVLDLTDKDFWLKDKNSLFKQMRKYADKEDDDTKLESFVYDYIFNAYETEAVKKKNYTVEIVLGKANGKGWLVTEDSELKAVLEYEAGVDVAAYILSEFNTWLEETHEEELEKAM